MASKKKAAIRHDFRTSVFARDQYRCRGCGRTQVRLDAHHISPREEMPGGGYVEKNGISLCDPEGASTLTCHQKAEKALKGGKVPGYSRDELYKLIGSSFIEAHEQSKNAAAQG